jgi:hypothetical protein
LTTVEGVNQLMLDLPEGKFASGAYIISLSTDGGVHTGKIFKTR